jgi:hypothetical protein
LAAMPHRPPCFRHIERVPLVDPKRSLSVPSSREDERLVVVDVVVTYHSQDRPRRTRLVRVGSNGLIVGDVSPNVATWQPGRRAWPLAAGTKRAGRCQRRQEAFLRCFQARLESNRLLAGGATELYARQATRSIEATTAKFIQPHKMPPKPVASVKNRTTAHCGPCRQMGANASGRWTAPPDSSADS